MAIFDFDVDELHAYRSAVTCPDDFDQFWHDTIADARRRDTPPSWDAYDSGLRLVDSYDVGFAGWDGQQVKGWLHVPAGADRPLPTVVQYVGYGGGRGLAHEKVLWALAGYAHFVMDTRGQGSAGSPGDTADPEPEGSNAHHPGFMTRGVLNRDTYYYRRVFTDAVRAVDAVRGHPLVDEHRVAVTGGSQGGGITLAVAGLRDDVIVAMPDVPFLCDFPRAVDLVDTNPYGEIRRYLHTHRDHVDRVFDTLRYFDGVNFAARASARALFSVGLMDETCPPSTVFAAHNAYAGPRDIEVYRFNNHEGGESFQEVRQLAFLRELFG